MMHRTNTGTRVDCQLPGPRSWYVVDEWEDPRGNGEGFDGRCYSLESPAINGGHILNAVAIFNSVGRYFKIINY